MLRAPTAASVQEGAREPSGAVVQEGAYYKVCYRYQGAKYELGWYETREEAARVVDVLAIKEAVDAGVALAELRLNFQLDRYDVDGNTAAEIRNVSFQQVVHDLEVCAIQPLRPLGSSVPSTWAGTQATASQYVDATSRVQEVSGMQLSTDHLDEDAGGSPQDAAAPPTVPRGLPGLPPRPPHRGAVSNTGATTRRQQAAENTAEHLGHGASAAAQAFHAAGAANAAAAAAAGPPVRDEVDGVQPVRTRGPAAVARQTVAADSAAPGGDGQGRAITDEDAHAVLDFVYETHPFKGITKDNRGPLGSMCGQFSVTVGQDGKPKGGGRTRLNVRLPNCNSAAEAAVTWDLSQVWRRMVMNEGLDDFGAMAQGGLVCAGVPPTIVERRQRMLNFAISTYTPLLSRLRACKAHPDVQALMHKMHASGELRELALAGYRERLEAAAKSGAATGHVRAQAGPSRVRSAGAAAVGGGDDSSEQPGGDGAAEAVDGPSGTQAGARAGRAAIKQRGGSAGFRGITRTSGGRFVANVHVSLNKVRSALHAHWLSPRAESVVRFAGSESAGEAAAVHDIMQLWRALQYGQAVATISTQLNFGEALYQCYLPRLEACKGESDLQAFLAELQQRGDLKRFAPKVASDRPTPARKRQQVAVDAAGVAQDGAGEEGERRTRARHAAAAPRAEPHVVPAVDAPAADAGQPSTVSIYEPAEEARVHEVERLFAEVRNALASTPGLSEVQVVGYMALWLRGRDVRRLDHAQITGWHQTGKHELVREHVVRSLPRMAVAE